MAFSRTRVNENRKLEYVIKREQQRRSTHHRSLVFTVNESDERFDRRRQWRLWRGLGEISGRRRRLCAGEIINRKKNRAQSKRAKRNIILISHDPVRGVWTPRRLGVFKLWKKVLISKNADSCSSSRSSLFCFPCQTEKIKRSETQAVVSFVWRSLSTAVVAAFFRHSRLHWKRIGEAQNPVLARCNTTRRFGLRTSYKWWNIL